MRHLQQEVESSKSLSSTLEKDLEKAREDKFHAEQRMNESVRRLEEGEHKRKVAERDSKRAIEAAENARMEATAAEREKLESQRLAVERSAALERVERRCETLEREREELRQVRTLVAPAMLILCKDVSLGILHSKLMCLLAFSSRTNWTFS